MTASSFFRRDVENRMESYRLDTADNCEGVRNGTVTMPYTDFHAARINEIVALGTYIRAEDGGNLLGKVVVWDKERPERFFYQVVVHRGELVMIFWSKDRDDHRRRLLVTFNERHFLEMGPHKTIPHHGKYAAAASEIAGDLRDKNILRYAGFMLTQ